MTLPRKVEQYIEKEGLLSPGDRILAGVSGGADSLCLLVILEEICRKRGLYLAAAHINHMIRGKDADDDEAFVRDFCRDRGIDLVVERVDIPMEAAKRQQSEEETGREVRQAVFERIMNERQLTKLALAHHRNDLAETMLYNMARGTGLAGLASLRSRRGNVVRPLLCAEREEIEAYLKSEGIAYRTDLTNFDDDHTRNRIRHHVLPYLTEGVNDRTLRHMAALAETTAETVDFLRREALSRLAPCLDEIRHEEASSVLTDSSFDDTAVPDGYRVGRLFFDEDPVIVRTGIMILLEKLNGPRRDVGRVHLEDVIDLGKGPCGRHLDLPGFSADKTREGLILRRVTKEEVRKKLSR